MKQPIGAYARNPHVSTRKKQHTMKKSTAKATIQIHDSKVGKYRVKSVGKNNEILQVSESLESVGAVKKHIVAMQKLWDASLHGKCDWYDVLIRLTITDHTKGNKFKKYLTV